MARIETVLIVNRDSKILLGLKHPMKKFGGKWNGFGGGLEDGESLEECAVRETRDETGITPQNLKKLGVVLFSFETGEQDHEVHFYQADNYEGVLDTSKDFLEYREFSPEELVGIYHNMMPADRYWLPFFISGKMFKGTVQFSKDFTVSHYELNEVPNLN